MIAQAVIAPIGACITLYGKKLFCVGIATSLLIVHMVLAEANADELTGLTIGNDPLTFPQWRYGPESEMAVYTSMGCLLAVLVLYFLGFEGCFTDTMLRSDSWSTQTEHLSSSTKSLCPFTGEEAEMQCPCCLTLIHSSAFFEEGVVLKGFAIGEGPCLWRKAQNALLRKESPAIGRLLLDEAMQIRSNFLLGGVGDACIGCVTYIKALHLLPRLSTVLICLGSFAGFLPYAFHQLIKELTSSRVLLDVLSVYSVFCSVSGVLVILHSFQILLEFRKRHPTQSIQLPWFWTHLEVR